MDSLRPDWYLDELAHAGGEHLDPAYVATYERKAGTDPAGDVALLRELGLDGRGVLVDLGAGAGTLALAAAPHCGRVVAVDVSPAMLAILREKVARSGATNVEVARGGFLSYDHQGPPADFVYSRNALHHLPDFWKALALARVAALLRPGGVLFLRDLIYDLDPGAVPTAFESWLGNATARPEDGWTRAELAEHIRGEFSTFTWLLEPMLARAGFTIRSREIAPGGIFAAYVCVKR